MDDENSLLADIANEPIGHTNEEISCLYNEVIKDTEVLRQLLLNHLVYLKKPMNRDWLTSAEVLNYLRISKRSLQRYRDNNILRYTVVLGNYRYLYEDVLEIMQNSK